MSSAVHASKISGSFDTRKHELPTHKQPPIEHRGHFFTYRDFVCAVKQTAKGFVASGFRDPHRIFADHKGRTLFNHKHTARKILKQNIRQWWRNITPARNGRLATPRPGWLEQDAPIS